MNSRNSSYSKNPKKPKGHCTRVTTNFVQLISPISTRLCLYVCVWHPPALWARKSGMSGCNDPLFHMSSVTKYLGISYPTGIWELRFRSGKLNCTYELKCRPEKYVAYDKIQILLQVLSRKYYLFFYLLGFSSCSTNDRDALCVKDNFAYEQHLDR
jgi:hypothetical protein